MSSASGKPPKRAAGNAPASHAPAAPPRHSPAAPAVVPLVDVHKHEPAAGKPVPRRPRSPWPAVAILSTLVVGVGVAAAVIFWPHPAPLSAHLLAAIPDQEVTRPSELRFRVKTPKDAGELAFALGEAPPGAKIDAKSGEFAWQPAAAQAAGEYTATVVATRAADGQTEQRQFKIAVRAVLHSPELAAVDEQHAEVGQTLRLTLQGRDPDHPPTELRYRLLQGASSGATLDAATGAFQWTPRSKHAGRLHLFEVRVEKQAHSDLSAAQQFMVRVSEKPVEVAKVDPAPAPPPANTTPAEPPPTEAQPPAPQDLTAEDDAKILELYADKHLCDRRQYAALRHIFARRFEQTYADKIRSGLGADYDKVTAWLNDHVDMKEELLTAVDAQRDDIAGVFRLFAQLLQKFPNDVEPFGELAIATAVTWDQPRAVYDFSGPVHQAKAVKPEGQIGAMENFQYLVEGDRVLQRARYLPWEFLVHVVDHTTPLEERRWAVINYLPKRSMIGTCYKDVPYDYGSLNSNHQNNKLGGKPYTLPLIRELGGVCAHQADFSARVAKCLSVPAVAVHGQALSGDLHAWVMWVELKGVSKANINFSLESTGRYFGDKYYVGTLRDPHTGQQMTDRQLERRLHTVGLNPLAKRHAALVMRAYPMVCTKANLDFERQLALLNEVIALCPGNEDAWRTAAELAQTEDLGRPRIKALTQLLNKLFDTFAAFPDFTWEVFDKLIRFQKAAKDRDALYARLVQLYEQAGRPDLACEARLKLADYLVEEKRDKDAVEGLAFTIKKFPEESRYVPRLLDKLEAICKDLDKAGDHLVRFYQEFLPLVPASRDDRISPHFVAMYRRGAQRFQQYNRADLAQACEMRLQQAQATYSGRK